MESINLKTGDSVVLRFKSLATAGYLWSYEMDKSGIVSVTPEANNDNAPTGQSLDGVFTVSGIHPGTAHLTFTQSRSWQKAEPAAVKEYNVQVQ